MNEARETAETFERERDHLFAVAYRMLGTASEAEDVIQDAWLRFSDVHADPEADIASPRAFLTKIVVRLCLDHIKSARVRRERYVGPWLPEPLATTGEAPPGADERVELAESLSIAFLVVLERLTPLERAAFLLRDVFDRPFDEVAATLGTTEAACRQLVSRARAHVAESRARHDASRDRKRELFQAFMTACATNDPAALGRLLADDVVARSDGGGKVHAALRPIFGRDRVVRFILGVLKKGLSQPGAAAAAIGTPRFVMINGEPGVVIGDESGDKVAVTIAASGERINDVFIVVNPDKLTRCGT